MPYENYSPEIPVNDEIPSSNGFPEPDGEQQPPREKAKKGKKQPASKKVEKKKQAPKPSVNLADSQIVERLKALATSQNLRLISGLILSGLGLYLLIVFISYFSTCIADQSQVDNIPVGETVGITNAGGEGGARIGEFLINGSFGLGSVVIVFWLIAMGLRNLIGYPRFKSVNFTIKCLIALITTSLIIGLLNVGFNNTVNWGGVHGRYVNERIIHYIGWSGAVILSLVMLGIFVLICLRDVVKWIIRLKRKADEKRREIMEARAEAKRRRDEIEEMRRREAEDAAKSGEAPAPEPENIVVEQKSLEFGNSDTHFENGENYVIPDELPEDNSYSSLYGNPRPVASEEATQASLDSTATEKDINDEGGYALPDDDVVESTMTEHVVREAGHESANAIRQTETATEISGEDPALAAGATALNQMSASTITPELAPATNEVGEGTESTSVDKVIGESDPAVSEEQPSPSDEMVINVNTIATDTSEREHRPFDPNHFVPYKFPPTEYMRPGVEKISVDVEEQMKNKELIRSTLLDYGIPIISIEATVGPTVTLYEIRPDNGVKISKIRNLVDDIAMRLAANGVRIIAPIPGRGTVGIEVANKDPQTVSMRTVLQSQKYRETKYELPLAIGCTISNDVYIADLAKMPHLLVAGATGQGKSVGLNAIITSLLYCKRPEELKFVMIDPKMVEFSLYAQIEAHYLAKIPDCDEPIITDKNKVAPTLSSLVQEMENRYQLLRQATVRNIVEYNKKYKEGLLNPAQNHRHLPYIVVIVDEFSDLIMTAGKEVETPIALLAQKARAVGIHVIIATQRPSTDVITGIIKANFPVRIAFKVSSGVDSKTILDTPGAQQLIGRGDMLISSSSEMVRVQCAFIDTPEVELICDYINRQPYGQGAYILPEPTIGEGGDDDMKGGNTFGEVDPLFKEIARLVVTSNVASTSSLQRRYNIGYNRAGRIMDQLEAKGIVGPAHGGKPRNVLIDPMSLDDILANI